MSIITLLFLSFLFSTVFFVIFLIAFRHFSNYFKNAPQNKQSGNNTTDTINRDQEKLFKTKKDNIERRLYSLRDSEELFQSRLKEFENDSRYIQKSKYNLETQLLELQTKNNELAIRENEINQQKEEIELLNQHKSEFMTNMSHELRTPLNSILTLTQVLLKNKTENLDEKQIKYLRTVYSSGKTLLSLINDVLDIAKIDAGKTDIFIEAIEIETIKKELFDTFYIQQEKNNITFTIEIDRNTPRIIYSDKKRLLQILRNILSNAFKYTEKGYVKLYIEKHNINEEHVDSVMSIKDKIAFSVEDTGIGIEREKQKIIFDPFVQADGSTTRKYGGTGLGLSISRKYAKLLGGDIKLESVFGKGSKFKILLPYSKKTASQTPTYKGNEIQQTAAENSVNNQNKIREKQFRQKRILLINSDTRYIFQFTSIIENLNALVSASDNLTEGMKKLYLYPDIKLILISSDLAKAEDYKLLKEITSNVHLKTINIIILNNIENSAKIQEDYSEFNISGFFPDKIDSENLAQNLSHYLN